MMRPDAAAEWNPRRSALSLRLPERLFAIGDIHGRFDLFRRIINLVGRDNADRLPANVQIVLLGNIIDRGPDAAKIVRGCMKITASNNKLVVLKGNHEDMMVEALDGNLTIYGHWLHFGGRETLLSWGVDAFVANGPATMENLTSAAQTIGKEVIDWLRRLPLYHRHGKYLFVHAGIKPGTAIDDQQPDDFMWARDEFLNSQVSHNFVVVHGHTATDNGPEFRFNRIGIDTGAYRTGRLTALGIEQGKQWTFSTIDEDFALGEKTNAQSY